MPFVFSEASYGVLRSFSLRKCLLLICTVSGSTFLSTREEHLSLQSSGFQTDLEKLRKVSSLSHLLRKVPLPFPPVTLEIKGRVGCEGGTPLPPQPSGAEGGKSRGSRASLTTLYVPVQVELYKILSQNTSKQTNKMEIREKERAAVQHSIYGVFEMSSY